jgi:hypothetical protein
MDDRTRPDTNVVLLRRQGDPSEAERERVASTIFAEPDDVATFSRGNLVPPRADARDANDEPAPSADPFFDRLQAPSNTDETQRTELADDSESTDAYFDRLATQTPAEMSTSGAPSPAGQANAGKRTAPIGSRSTQPTQRPLARATYPVSSDCPIVVPSPPLTVRMALVHGHARRAGRARRWHRDDW